MLTIHRAERADTMIGPLAELLSQAPPDPFTADVIAVPSKGVERWVMQQLSLHLGAEGALDGVGANILFPSPAHMIDDALSTLAGLPVDEDPWTGSPLVWAVLAVMDECADEPWCSMLAHHLGRDDGRESHRRGRRYSTAVTLARLFTAYGNSRPSMIADWAGDVDSDGFDSALRKDMVWQAAFWRRLRERIGTPSPAERLPDACTAIVAQPGLVNLPARLSVFGPTRLSRTELAVLEALAAHRDLHLWLTHPSPVMWDTLRGLAPATRRRDDHTILRLANPLLISLSRDIREMQQLLPAAADIHHLPKAVGSSLLSRIQDDIRHGRDPAALGRMRNDGSIAVHECYGQVRQVEVLRESLLRLFNDDASLQPRDVIVLCPAVETFAPLISTAFGQSDAPHPGHRLRVRLADRGPARMNPLLETLQTLLGLADGRVTASEVRDLAASGPVARLFKFSTGDLETLGRWVADAGARWGISEQQRELFELGSILQNTFDAAFDRILLGVTADESDLALLGEGQVLPLDDVASSDVDLAGRFAEFIDRLHEVLDWMRGSHPAQVWRERLEAALDVLTEVGEPQAWQRIEAGRRVGEATQHAGQAVLSLADVRALLADEFRPRPTRSNFRTGEITVATLVPMRFVPHRVVAIIGLDDGAFPRVASVQGDDVLALDPCLGERDPRSEDRQLLLDALMSATDHLLICYTGFDPVTGEPRPPSAPLADVIDAVRATVEDEKAVVKSQPLQPFDDANFVAPQPFSFDTEALAAAKARRRVYPKAPFLASPLAPPVEDQVGLDDLVDFLANPTRAFLRQRLGVTIPGAAGDVADAWPLNISGLPRWDIGDRILSAVLSGATLEAACVAELRRGTLPPGRLALDAIMEIADVVNLIKKAVATHARDNECTSRDVAAAVGDHRLAGTITNVYGTTLITASFSKLAAKHRISAWARLLALCVAHPGDWQAVVIGRADDDQCAAQCAVLTAPAEPVPLLAQLLEIRAAGMREPLPLPPETSCAYAGQYAVASARRPELSDRVVSASRSFLAVLAAGSSGSDTMAAKNAWTSKGRGEWRTIRENDDTAICCVHGPDAPFDVLWDPPAPEAERWFDEPKRFAQLARRVWEPLIEHETPGRLR
jgi:exodeoxyribonuclease V gamma subunit